MKRKKEVVQEPKKWYDKLKTVNWYNVAFLSLLICLSAFSVKSALEVRKAIKKEEISNYVCQIIGSDDQIGVLAMRCMVK